MKDVTVLIPTYRPDRKFEQLLARLSVQTHVPERVLILNTLPPEQTMKEGKKGAGTKKREEIDLSEVIDRYQEKFPLLSVFHIDKKDFDHGGTRDLGFRFSDTEYVLCMTQDALPGNRKLIEHLLAAFQDDEVAAAYARQASCPDADPAERFTRMFNYPKTPAVKSKEDLPRLGIKTFFCSDVCAMWRRDLYLAHGGFEERTIFNEDMIFAGKLILAGWKIAYVSDAVVLHSHNYTGRQQMKRNFDLGVSQADHPEVFSAASSVGEGVRLVKETAGYLVRSGNFLQVPVLFWKSGCRYFGYAMGKRYRALPRRMVLRMTDNQAYWKK